MVGLHRWFAYYAESVFANIPLNPLLLLSWLFGIGRYLSGVNHSPMDSCGIRDDSDQLSFRFEDLPSTFDWREKGVIGDIRDQKRVRRVYTQSCMKG